FAALVAAPAPNYLRPSAWQHDGLLRFFVVTNPKRNEPVGILASSVAARTYVNSSPRRDRRRPLGQGTCTHSKRLAWSATGGSGRRKRGTVRGSCPALWNERVRRLS